MKILFFNRFFFPDNSATSQILSDLAFHLASKNNEVHVVTSRAASGDRVLEIVAGVTIHRVATAITGPHTLFERAAAYVRFYLGARAAARQLVQRGDIVVLKTDPPLLSAVVGPIAKGKGAKVVVWLQDIFPEVASEYGIPGMKGPIGRALRSARDRSLAAADRVVAIGDRMAATIRNLEQSEIKQPEVIHNWANGSAIVPLDSVTNPLRQQWNLLGKFVVGYSGNLGRVHEFDTMLSAARELSDDQNIQFLIIGGGPRLSEVESAIKRDNLRNIRLEPHQARAMLAESLGVADVHLSVLKPEFEGLVLPSKLYGILAAGRPTIFIGDRCGETAAILAQTGSGFSVSNGDAYGLVSAIRIMRDDAHLRRQMGIRARAAFEERFTMEKAFNQWTTLLDSLVV